MGTSNTSLLISVTVVYRASTRYTTVPSCYIDLAIELIWRSPHELLFLVLNYDNLLESALTRYDSTLTFSNIGDFVRRERDLTVVKIHGSIDWFKPIDSGSTWFTRVDQADIFAKPAQDEIIVRKKVDTAINCETEPGHWLYPLITAPLAGKDETDIVCPQSHIEEARRFLADCKKFLIIGTSGLDGDLLRLLNGAVPDSPTSVHLVTEEPDRKGSPAVWKRFQAVRAFSSIMDPPILFNSGFRAYLTSPDFEKFCAA